jgi:hypothetical protein
MVHVTDPSIQINITDLSMTGGPSDVRGYDNTNGDVEAVFEAGVSIPGTYHVFYKCANADVTMVPPLNITILPPSLSPTSTPTYAPTNTPTSAPSASPTSASPTTISPTSAPSTASPTGLPTIYRGPFVRLTGTSTLDLCTSAIFTAHLHPWSADRDHDGSAEDILMSQRHAAFIKARFKYEWWLVLDVNSVKETNTTLLASDAGLPVALQGVGEWESTLVIQGSTLIASANYTLHVRANQTSSSYPDGITPIQIHHLQVLSPSPHTQEAHSDFRSTSSPAILFAPGTDALPELALGATSVRSCAAVPVDSKDDGTHTKSWTVLSSVCERATFTCPGHHTNTFLSVCE